MGIARVSSNLTGVEVFTGHHFFFLKIVQLLYDNIILILIVSPDKLHSFKLYFIWR